MRGERRVRVRGRGDEKRAQREETGREWREVRGELRGAGMREEDYLCVKGNEEFDKRWRWRLMEHMERPW